MESGGEFREWGAGRDRLWRHSQPTRVHGVGFDARHRLTRTLEFAAGRENFGENPAGLHAVDRAGGLGDQRHAQGNPALVVEFLTMERFFRGYDDREPRQGGRAKPLAGRESGGGMSWGDAGQTHARPGG
jgi:hypothetical protein